MKRSPTELLLERLCVDLGFCLSPTEWTRLATSPPTSVREFTDAVFAAEGINPEHADRHLWRKVRSVIAEHFERIESGGAA